MNAISPPIDLANPDLTSPVRTRLRPGRVPKSKPEIGVKPKPVAKKKTKKELKAEKQDLVPQEDIDNFSDRLVANNLRSPHARRLAEALDNARGYKNRLARESYLLEIIPPDIHLLAKTILYRKDVKRAIAFINERAATKRAGNSICPDAHSEKRKPLPKEVLDLAMEINRRKCGRIEPAIPPDPNLDLLMRFASGSVFAPGSSKA